MEFSLFIHPLMDTDCFHVLTAVDNAAVNVGVQISLQNPAFSSSGCIPRSGIAGSYGNSIFIF